MRIRPADIADEMIMATLSQNWGVGTRQVAYLPVGFGSHHWSAESTDGDRYFVTVDLFADADVDHDEALTRLIAAIETARRLSERLPEAHGPLPTVTGAVVAPIGRGSMTVYPELIVVPESPEPAKDRDAVIELLGRLHALTDVVAGVARADPLIIRRRDQLERTVSHGVVDRAAGPYTGRLLTGLAKHAQSIGAGLERYDALASSAASRRGDWVITHGEPHPGNLFLTTRGLRLVDWDSALLAPAGRDLADFGADAAARYGALTGRVVPDDDLELYRLRWELDEIAEYTAWFSRPHTEDADTAIAFGGLEESLGKLAAMTAGFGAGADSGH